MRAETNAGTVIVRMTAQEADDLRREIDKWPDLPEVERDLVDALKGLSENRSAESK